MPEPVSPTSTIAPSGDDRVTIDSHPPFGIASRALRKRFRNTCCSLYSMPRTTGAVAASSLRTWMRPVRIWCSRSESTSLMTALTSTGPVSTCAGRARLSRPLTIFAARNVWRSIFSSTCVFGSSGSVPCMSICTKLEMPVSGVFTSCATPAARRPMDAIFSEICSCSSS